MGQIKIEDLYIVILNNNNETRKKFEKELLNLNLKNKQILTGNNLEDAIEIIKEIPSYYGILTDLNLNQMSNENIYLLKKLKDEGYKIPVINYSSKPITAELKTMFESIGNFKSFFGQVYTHKEIATNLLITTQIYNNLLKMCSENSEKIKKIA